MRRIQLKKLDKPARHDAVAAISDRLQKLGHELVAAGQGGAQVRVGGSAALGKQANDAVQADLALAEEVSLPITLVILVFVFGGLVAAGLPVLAAAFSAGSGVAVLLALSPLPRPGKNTGPLVALPALGLSLDHWLFLGRRDPAGPGGRPAT